MPARSLRELMELDPRALFAQVRCPMLAIGGTKDVQCDAQDALDLAAVNVLAQAHIIEDMTHLLRRDDQPAAMLEYGRLLKKPVDAELLEVVTQWLSTESTRDVAAPTRSSAP